MGLAIVWEFLPDVPDVLSFAHICSTLRPLAIGWLLSMKPVYLGDGASVRRLHSFLFDVDAPTRTTHIRALNIVYPLYDSPQVPTLPGDSSLLKDILTLRPSLESIWVTFVQDGPESRQCTDDDPQVIKAITGIQTLRSLSVYGCS